MNEGLVRTLLGIAFCATACPCCRMHARIARMRLEEFRASLGTEEAAEFDRIFHTPYEGEPL